MNNDKNAVGNPRYLDIVCEGDTGPEYERRMLSRNQPRGLLKMHLTVDGERAVFHYNINGLVSLKEFTERTGKDCSDTLVRALERLSDTLFSYMLSESKLELAPERIFLREDSGAVSFCYNPGKQESFSESLQKLTEYWIRALEPEKEGDVLLLYALYRKAREPGIGLTDFVKFYHEKRTEADRAEIPERVEPVPEERMEIMEELGLETGSRYLKEAYEEPRREKRLRRQEALPDEPPVPPVSGMAGSEDKKESIWTRLKPYSFEIGVAAAVAAGIALIVFT